MRHHAPRKKKKKAKKLKAVNDGFVMARTAMITASSYAQLATISSTPGLPQLKALRVMEIVIDTAKAVAASVNDVRHWTHFVPRYTPHG